MSLGGRSRWLLIDHGNWEKCPKTGKVFQKGKKGEPGGHSFPPLVPGKAMEQLTLEMSSRCVNDKKIIRTSQHGSTKGKSCLTTKGKSCLTNLINLSDEATGFGDERRAVAVVYLDFRKAFNAVSHKILIEKLVKPGLDEQRGGLKTH